MNIVTTKSHTTKQISRTLRSVKVAEELWAVLMDVETVTTLTNNKGQSKTETTVETTEHLVTSKDRDKLHKGEALRGQQHILLTSAAAEMCRHHNFLTVIQILEKGKPDSRSLRDLPSQSEHEKASWKRTSWVRHHPHSAFTNENGDKLIPVKMDIGENKFVAMNGKPLPKMMHGEYISGHFDNAHYDLEKAAAHLLTRSDVTVLSNKRGQHTAKTADEAIHDIPGYNSERGRTQCLSFLWHPSQEDWEKMVDIKQNKRRSLFGGWEIVFDLDILGLRACGAALFDAFHKAVEPDEDDDDF